MTKKERAERKEIVAIRKQLSILKGSYKNLSKDQRVEAVEKVEDSLDTLKRNIVSEEHAVELKPVKKATAKKAVKK